MLINLIWNWMPFLLLLVVGYGAGWWLLRKAGVIYSRAEMKARTPLFLACLMGGWVLMDMSLGGCLKIGPLSPANLFHGVISIPVKNHSLLGGFLLVFGGVNVAIFGSAVAMWFSCTHHKSQATS